jgi:uncharacterized protein
MLLITIQESKIAYRLGDPQELHILRRNEEMAFFSHAVTVVLILTISVLLVFTGWKKQPGIGILVTILIIGITLWLRKDNLAYLGLYPPQNWVGTFLLGLVLGVAIQLVVVAFIEPLSEKVTKTYHDHSALESVKGNWKVFLQWMVVVWILVVFLEEGIYRGFLITEVSIILGKRPVGLAANIVITSVVFGLSHGYQNRCGIISTGFVGILLGCIFIWSEFNLWLAIFTHGFIDTIGIGFIAINGDKYIRHKIWNS